MQCSERVKVSTAVGCDDCRPVSLEHCDVLVANERPCEDGADERVIDEFQTVQAAERAKRSVLLIAGRRRQGTPRDASALEPLTSSEGGERGYGAVRRSVGCLMLRVKVQHARSRPTEAEIIQLGASQRRVQCLSRMNFGAVHGLESV